MTAIFLEKTAMFCKKMAMFFEKIAVFLIKMAAFEEKLFMEKRGFDAHLEPSRDQKSGIEW